MLVKKFFMAVAVLALGVVVAQPLVSHAKNAKKDKPKYVDPRSGPDPVWPPPPDEPRLKWVAMYHDEYDVGAVKKSKFLDVISGVGRSVAFISRPVSVAADKDGKIFVGDFHQGIFVIDPANKVLQRLATGVNFKQLTGILADDHFLYVADSARAQILILDKEGQYISGIGRKGEMLRPTHMALSPDKKTMWVVDNEKHQVLGFDMMTKTLTKVIGKRGGEPGEFNYPVGIATLSNGDLVVGDFGNFRIQILNTNGKPLKWFGTPGDVSGSFFRLKGIAVDSEDHIYAADGAFANIQVFDRTGQLLTYIGENGPRKGQFSMPVGICFQGNMLYVADQFNSRVQVIQYLPEKKG